MKQERVLIIGGTGLIGCKLIDRLANLGCRMTVITRIASRVRLPASSIVADISKTGWTLQAGIDPFAFDMVVHLAYATTQDAAYDRAVTVDSVVETLDHFKLSHL